MLTMMGREPENIQDLGKSKRNVRARIHVVEFYHYNTSEQDYAIHDPKSYN